MPWTTEDWTEFNRLPCELQRLVWKQLHTEALQRVHEEYQLRFGNFWLFATDSFRRLAGWEHTMFANYRSRKFAGALSLGVCRFWGAQVAPLPENYWYSGITNPIKFNR